MVQANPGHFADIVAGGEKNHLRIRRSANAGYVHIKEAPPVSISARQHGKAVLECSASGQPAPSITWLKDGVPIINDWDQLDDRDPSHSSLGETKSRISLDCVTQEDAGDYECVATTAGYQDSVRTQVTVVSFQDTGCHPTNINDINIPPKIIQWLETYLQVEGEDARLKCRSVGGPHKTTWTGPQDDDISNTSRTRVDDKGDLIIRSIGWQDMGSYTCVTSNGWGVDRASTFLYPMAPSQHQH
jgi:hypothetical protein